MKMSRVVKHLNSASNGPVGVEHILPSDTNSLNGWFSQFANSEPIDIASSIHESWSSAATFAQQIASGLKSFNPRSFYHLPCEWSPTHDWLLFENEHHVMYIPEPSTNVRVVGDTGVVELIRCFDGYRFGYNPHPDDDFLRNDSGFQKLSDLKMIDSTDDDYLWEYDDTVLGGYWFFTTSCGNRLYWRQNGTIAKWNHSNCEIDDAFDSFDEFAQLFVQQYVKNESDERSPLFY
jgi:hypothetical protein